MVVVESVCLAPHTAFVCCVICSMRTGPSTRVSQCRNGNCWPSTGTGNTELSKLLSEHRVGPALIVGWSHCCDRVPDYIIAVNDSCIWFTPGVHVCNMHGYCSFWHVLWSCAGWLCSRSHAHEDNGRLRKVPAMSCRAAPHLTAQP